MDTDNNKKHFTCIDATEITQPPHSQYVCGPDCPKVPAITWEDVIAMYEKLTDDWCNGKRPEYILINGEWVKFPED